MKRRRDQSWSIATLRQVITQAVVNKVGHALRRSRLLHVALLRLEHPSQLIDQIQYHNREGRGKYLPAAEYSFVTQVEERGVYSFCMCPGGFVIPAATGPQQLVVNGMSPSNRGTPI